MLKLPDHPDDLVLLRAVTNSIRTKLKPSQVNIAVSMKDEAVEVRTNAALSATVLMRNARERERQRDSEGHTERQRDRGRAGAKLFIGCFGFSFASKGGVCMRGEGDWRIIALAFAVVARAVLYLSMLTLLSTHLVMTSLV